ncbi:MAG: tRNA (adenosine(37)-N6)-threonylcarbamoyltransferase complex ATPase subunit type 1 TsaE [Nitrospiraceae bacterium]
MRSSEPKRLNVTKPAKAPPSAARRLATPSLPWKLTSTSHQQTDWLGQVLGRTLRGGETIALYGPLGAGKTALVRGIAEGLGASPTTVTSPTFVVIHEYQGRLPLAHMDWYRIRSLRELESTGVMEYFSGQTVTVVEWADKGFALLPQDRIEVTLSHRTAQSRSIQLNATGPTSEDVLARARKTHLAPPHQDSDKKGTTRS